MDFYLTARADRILESFAKGLPSALRGAGARKITDYGGAASRYAQRRIDANAWGRSAGPNGALMRGEAPRVMRAARNPLPAGLGVRDTAPRTVARRKKKNVAWGSWPKTPPRGNRAADVFNPGARG